MGKDTKCILTDSILVSEESHITSGNFAVILGEGNANSNASDNTNDDVNGTLAIIPTMMPMIMLVTC